MFNGVDIDNFVENNVRFGEIDRNTTDRVENTHQLLLPVLQRKREI